MDPDSVNDKVAAVVTDAAAAAPDQPAEMVDSSAEALAVVSEAPVVDDVESDGTVPAELSADEAVDAPLVVEEPPPVVEEQEPPLVVEEPPPVVEERVQVDTPVHAVAVPVDRTAEILDTFAHYQAGWNEEQAALKEKTEQLLQELSAITGKVALLSTTTAAMTVTIQKLAEESEQMVNWSENVKGVSALSKLFQIVAILVLVLLLGGMGYLAVRQYQAGHHLHQAEAGIAAAIKVQQKQIAEYDRHFANLVGVEIKKEREVSMKTSLQERINRLRNGVAEQQLHRKTNGDWFVVTGKSESALSDPDLIEELNQAFTKSGRTLTTPYLVPPHKVVVLLRGNGKGGTDIVVTKEVAP